MEIVEVATGLRKVVIIKRVEENDWKILTKKRYSFAWKSFRQIATVHKLQIEGEEEILGVIGLVDVPDEKRIEIKLISTSLENRGKHKRFDRIAGCLIAYACRLSISEYKAEACVSLVPKTELIKHYMNKYYMLYAGWQMYLEGAAMKKLLKEYI